MNALSNEPSTPPFQVEPGGTAELVARYNALRKTDFFTWESPYRKLRLLGSGGQGVVFLSERLGSDRFALPVALKIFSPEHYRDVDDYEQDMARTAAVAARVAVLQHDNVLDVHNFVERDGIRFMVMEWVDGFDLKQLLTPGLLARASQRFNPDRWDYLNDVIVTAGPTQPRLKPGVAIQVLRECLTGLSALHRAGLVHGDIKPSNIMLKRTGNAKIIDIGSAVDLRRGMVRRFWSPAYAAPEVLAGGENSPLSDLASLGYVLIEMLAGVPPFAGLETYRELLDAKRDLERRCADLLPEDVRSAELLVHLCQRLIAFDPKRRYSSAEVADLSRRGAAEFHRQLVRGDMASEYENDIRFWLEQLG